MKISRRLRLIYSKLIKANDTPHRISLGFAIGIFYGLFPFIGVIFTLVTAFILRANKAAALIGCFVTNTWMSAMLAVPSVKIGARIFGLQWQEVWSDILRYLKMPGIKDIFNALSSDVVIPALVGFLIIAFLMAAVSYFIILFLIMRYRGGISRRKE